MSFDYQQGQATVLQNELMGHEKWSLATALRSVLVASQDETTDPYPTTRAGGHDGDEDGDYGTGSSSSGIPPHVHIYTDPGVSGEIRIVNRFGNKSLNILPPHHFLYFIKRLSSTPSPSSVQGTKRTNAKRAPISCLFQISTTIQFNPITSLPAGLSRLPGPIPPLTWTTTKSIGEGAAVEHDMMDAVEMGAGSSRKRRSRILSGISIDPLFCQAHLYAQCRNATGQEEGRQAGRKGRWW